MESPLIQKGVQDVIEEGMVLCIEPGVSVPDVAGACIEEEIIVRGDGPELITRAPTRPWRKDGGGVSVPVRNRHTPKGEKRWSTSD